jgi:hypothetical protein
MTRMNSNFAQTATFTHLRHQDCKGSGKLFFVITEAFSESAGELNHGTIVAMRIL